MYRPRLLAACVFLASLAFGVGAVAAPRGISVHSRDPSLVPAYAAAGFHVVRTDLPWSFVVHHDGDHWEEFDAFYWACIQRGMKPLFILSYDARGALTVPRTRADWATFLPFVREAARRYIGAYFQVHGEPNLAENWEGRPDPVEYVQVFRRVKAALRDGHWTAAALGPGVGGTDGKQALGYLMQTIDAGILDVADAVAVQPYWAYDAAELLASYAAIHEMMGATARPLWVTEWGVPSAPGPWLSEAYQAEFYGWAFPASEASGVALSVAYVWIDDCTDPTDAYCHFGLVRYDGSCKPAFSVVTGGAACPGTASVGEWSLMSRAQSP